MKAMVLKSFRPVEERPLTLEDRPDPSPARGEVLIRVAYCGVCRTDLHTVEGEIVPPDLPVIPGHQVVGTVVDLGEGSSVLRPGDRVGLAWLGGTCGRCRFCLRGDENLCAEARFTGFHGDGGYAQLVTAREAFAYPVPDGFSGEQAAPLLCGGIIGYRAIRLSGAGPGLAVGLYGFGASAHVAIQVLVHMGARVHVMSRTPSHRALALDLGAAWAGTAEETPPEKMDASIVFAPEGRLVLRALEALEKGGTVVLAGIYMTPISEMDYERHLYNEKRLVSVTANTRADGRALLSLAAAIPIRTATMLFPLESANEALLAVKGGAIDGAAVLRVAGE
jgi:propanol-preferring alcohol dehydrogenase